MPIADCGLQIEAREPSGAGLRVEFAWHSDRYRHIISLIGREGAIIPLLESIEGASDEAWPPSPPLQTLSIEKLPDGRIAALLVGMAGGSHWSASVEPVAGSAELVFDVACRHAAAPAWLGSRYRRLSRAPKTMIEGQAIDIREREDEIEIAPAGISDGRGTTRWRFVVQAGT